MSAPSYASEPQIQYLHQVLEQIAKAEVLIPDFQRPVRWDDDQRKRLLDSITRGHPIGAVMVWRTTETPKHLDIIGDRRLGREPKSANRQYLLDGFQRLSTLFAALWPLQKNKVVGSDRPGARSEHRWSLGYHLVNEEWVFLDEIDDDERSFVLPGCILLDSVELLRFERRIVRPDADLLIERADAVASAVREYKIAIIPLVTESVEEAARTFALLNTEGTRMSQFDLINALTWTSTWSLRSELEGAMLQLDRIGWGNLEEKYLLAVLRAASNLDIYTGEASEVSKNLRAHPDVLDQTVRGLVLAGKFLAQHCDVLSLDLLPYSYQAVLLADVLRQHPAPSPVQEKHLIQWFWWTTASSIFSGISGYRLTSMQKYLRALVDGNKSVWPRRRTERTPFPNTITKDSARLRSLAIHLFRRLGRTEPLARSLKGQAIKAMMRGLHDTAHDSDAGNAFLVEDAEQDAFQRALKDRRANPLKALLNSHPLCRDAKVREMHFITDQAWDLLGAGKAAEFIDERRKTLDAYDERFLEDLGKPPGCP
jgi:hypothetical protein